MSNPLLVAKNEFVELNDFRLFVKNVASYSFPKDDVFKRLLALKQRMSLGLYPKLEYLKGSSVSITVTFSATSKPVIL